MVVNARENHYPEAAVSLMIFHGFWPKNDGPLTGRYFCRLLLTAFPYSLMISGSMVHLFYVLKGTVNADITVDIVVLTEGIFFLYVFFLYLSNVHEVLSCLTGVADFERADEPEGLQRFKYEHNRNTKLLYGYCLVGIIFFSLVCYLDEPGCLRKNVKFHRENTCGLLAPFWTPFDLEEHLILKRVLLLIQLYSLMVTLLPAALSTYCGVISIDFLTLRVRQIRQAVASISNSDSSEEKKAKLVFVVQHHLETLRLVTHYNKCIGKFYAGHYSLSALIMGILYYQILKDLSISGVCHLLGWICSLYLMCYSGQKLITESAAVADDLYNLQWEEFGIKLERFVLIMMTKFQKELYIATGVIHSFSHAFFLYVVQASYTYLTLLKQLNMNK